jgi:ribosomal protein S27AE
MATAFKEKTKNEQLANLTVSPAAQHKSTCTRCGGFMVNDSYLDLLNNVGESKFAAKRCVQCGEVVDPVILRNRATRHEAMMAPPARVLSI